MNKVYLKQCADIYSIPQNHIQYLQKLKNGGFEPKIIYDIGANASMARHFSSRSGAHIKSTSR